MESQQKHQQRTMVSSIHLINYKDFWIAMLVCGIVSLLFAHLLQIVSTCGNVFKNIPSLQQCKLSAITSNQFTSRPISLHACFALFLRKVLQLGPRNDNSSRLAYSPHRAQRVHIGKKYISKFSMIGGSINPAGQNGSREEGGGLCEPRTGVK